LFEKKKYSNNYIKEKMVQILTLKLLLK